MARQLVKLKFTGVASSSRPGLYLVLLNTRRPSSSLRNGTPFEEAGFWGRDASHTRGRSSSASRRYLGDRSLRRPRRSCRNCMGRGTYAGTVWIVRATIWAGISQDAYDSSTTARELFLRLFACKTFLRSRSDFGVTST